MQYGEDSLSNETDDEFHSQSDHEDDAGVDEISNLTPRLSSDSSQESASHSTQKSSSSNSNRPYTDDSHEELRE